MEQEILNEIEKLDFLPQKVYKEIDGTSRKMYSRLIGSSEISYG